MLLLKLNFTIFVRNRLFMMDLEDKKSSIIESFRHIEDEALIDTIQNILDYARKKEEEHQEIPEEHKNVVRERVRKYGDSSESYLNWDNLDKKIDLGE